MPNAAMLRGGVKTSEQLERIIGLGVEKVAISSAAITKPGIITEAARRVGSQSVVMVVDVKKTGMIQNATKSSHTMVSAPQAYLPMM